MNRLLAFVLVAAVALGASVGIFIWAHAPGPVYDLPWDAHVEWVEPNDYILVIEYESPLDEQVPCLVYATGWLEETYDGLGPREPPFSVYLPPGHNSVGIPAPRYRPGLDLTYDTRTGIELSAPGLNPVRTSFGSRSGR